MGKKSISSANREECSVEEEDSDDDGVSSAFSCAVSKPPLIGIHSTNHTSIEEEPNPVNDFLIKFSHFF